MRERNREEKVTTDSAPKCLPDPVSLAESLSESFSEVLSKCLSESSAESLAESLAEFERVWLNKQ